MVFGLPPSEIHRMTGPPPWPKSCELWRIRTGPISSLWNAQNLLCMKTSSITIHTQYLYRARCMRIICTFFFFLIFPKTVTVKLTEHMIQVWRWARGKVELNLLLSCSGKRTKKSTPHDDHVNATSLRSLWQISRSREGEFAGCPGTRQPGSEGDARVKVERGLPASFVLVQIQVSSTAQEQKRPGSGRCHQHGDIHR